MNLEALHKISYGMYIVCSKKNEKINGQIVNTVFQITSEPTLVAVSINKQNLTHDFILSCKMFTASILTKDVPMTLIGQFGFKSGRDIDKFAGVKYLNMSLGIPVIQDSTMAYIECEVVNQIDCVTHTIFIGKVVNADILQKAEAMTYAYYHEVKKGMSPKTAPTYLKQEANKGG